MSFNPIISIVVWESWKYEKMNSGIIGDNYWKESMSQTKACFYTEQLILRLNFFGISFLQSLKSAWFHTFWYGESYTYLLSLIACNQEKYVNFAYLTILQTLGNILIENLFLNCCAITKICCQILYLCIAYNEWENRLEVAYLLCLQKEKNNWKGWWEISKQ